MYLCALKCQSFVCRIFPVPNIFSVGPIELCLCFAFMGGALGSCFPFILAAHVNVDVVSLCKCEFYFDFVLKVMLQVSSKWEKDSSLPATGTSSKWW